MYTLSSVEAHAHMIDSVCSEQITYTQNYTKKQAKPKQTNQNQVQNYYFITHFTNVPFCFIYLVHSLSLIQADAAHCSRAWICVELDFEVICNWWHLDQTWNRYSNTYRLIHSSKSIEIVVNRWEREKKIRRIIYVANCWIFTLRLNPKMIYVNRRFDATQNRSDDNDRCWILLLFIIFCHLDKSNIIDRSNLRWMC